MNLPTPRIDINQKYVSELFNKFSNYGLVFYPVKANAFPELIKVLYKKGASFNVSSAHYLCKILKLNISSSRILWDNCFSDFADIDAAIDAGVKMFTVDSKQQVEYINNHCANAKFFIKISNSIVGSGTYKIGTETPLELIELIDNNKLLGFSFHLGIEMFNQTNIKKMIKYIKSFGKIQYINIGGGYEDLFTDNDLLDFLLLQKQEGWFDNIIFEPGRSLLNPASKLFTRVISIKQNGTNRFAKIDGSIYSGLIDRYIEQRHYTFNDHSLLKEKYMVYGFTSDSSDNFGIQLLSESLKIGDVVEVEGCGAYNFDMSCEYSGAKKLLMRMI